MNELNIDVETLMQSICEQLQKCDILQKDPKMIGILKGGAWVAQKLHQKLGIEAPLGELDISFYRDDFSKMGLNPTVQPSSIPWEIEDQHIILVDDVLFTGRTVRAALNEIFDFGRPASVVLVTLLDRKGCRELPFHVDVTGMEIECNKTIQVSGPDPLTVSLVDNSEEQA
ncbi:MAG: bifunctional pyr operon transcriptional regulator/uracil phosphoribosyltransferase PyrR [Thiotrichales bacterium]|nr:bifunctional pyr operon transcriptional regulator/uracil phosphoribosyltransferase PyrR [Thiotrichales bacterium]